MQRLSGIQRNLLHIKFQNMSHWLSKYIQQDEETLCQMRLYLTKSIHQCHVSYISAYMLTDYQSQVLEHSFTLKRMCEVGKKVNLIIPHLRLLDNGALAGGS